MKSNIALLITQALFLFCYQVFSYANEIAITFDDLPASIEESIETIIMRYLPIAVVMHEFFQKLKVSTTTPYPTAKLERVCANIKNF